MSRDGVDEICKFLFLKNSSSGLSARLWIIRLCMTLLDSQREGLCRSLCVDYDVCTLSRKQICAGIKNYVIFWSVMPENSRRAIK